MRNILIIFLLVAILFYGLYKGIEKQEAYECIKWEEMSERYDDFYYTDWQKEQCGIK